MKSLGAAKATDYTKEDFGSTDDSCDLVFDAVGKSSRERASRILAAKGKFVSVVG